MIEHRRDAGAEGQRAIDVAGVERGRCSIELAGGDIRQELLLTRAERPRTPPPRDHRGWLVEGCGQHEEIEHDASIRCLAFAEERARTANQVSR